MAQVDKPPTSITKSINLENAHTPKGQTAAILNRIHAAKNLDEFFLEIKAELPDLLGAEQATLYAVDRDKRELYSKYMLDPLNGVQEFRVPITEKSISGYCARFGKLMNIADAYDEDELHAISPLLQFDRSWDEKTGLRTRQMLAIPILYERKYLMGVLLLLNRVGSGKFTKEEVKFAFELSETLGIAFRNQQQTAQRRSASKFDYLLEHNLITAKELEKAISESRRKSVDVETMLMEQFRVPKQEIGQALSRFFNCPFMEFDDRKIPDPALIKGINFDYLKANFWLPFQQKDDTVDILIDNPKDLQKIEHIQALMKGLKPRFSVGLRKDILQYLYAAGGKHDVLDNINDILGQLGDDSMGVGEEEEDAAGVGENDNAIVRLANQIILDAYKKGASDIHIEPYSNRQDTVVRIRIDGRCQEYQRIPPSYRRALVSRIKIMSRLDIAERRKPQDGKIKFRLPTHKEIELRVATIPTANDNEDVVMRILAASEPLPLDALHMTPRNLKCLQELVEIPYGLILVVGPTGSGKTTTLHAALGYINVPERKIWTAEDPVEITQYGLRQVQVLPRIGFTFAAAMRSFLRADPDVIMVGEMRDEETAHIGIEASLTGHLVFSTLHTNSAPETITRLLDMGLDPFNFADALLGILAQRLVRTLCSACKKPVHPPEQLYQELRQSYGPEAFDALGIHYTPEFTVHGPVGCAECGDTGYKGRVGIHELLVSSPETKKMIQARARIAEIRAVATQEGMTTLLQDGILKILDGLTDYTQVKAVAGK